MSAILKAFAIAHAITDERVLLDRGDAQWSLKVIVAIYVSFPLINVLFTIQTVMIVFEIGDVSLWWSVWVALALVFIGVNIWTSGVYHANTETIWKLGNEIREDPDRGTRWARRRSNAFIYANAAYLAVLLWLVLQRV